MATAEGGGKSFLPTIQETSLPTINGRRQSRLNDPIHQFRQRETTQLLGSPSRREKTILEGREKIFYSSNEVKPNASRRITLIRKPSTDDIDVYLGRSNPTQAWEGSDSSSSQDPNFQPSSGMTEKERRKKIFRRLRSKSFDNPDFENDRSPSPPLDAKPTPEVKQRPSTAEKRRPSLSETSHSNSLGNIHRPRSSSAQRGQQLPSQQQRHSTPTRAKASSSSFASASSLKSKATSEKKPSAKLSEAPATGAASGQKPKTSTAKPSTKASRAFLRSGSKDDINVSYNSNAAAVVLPAATAAADLSPHISLPLSSPSVCDPVIAAPILLRSTPQVFWRCRLNAMIHIYHHPSYRCFEIIALDLLTGQELPHVFVDTTRVLEIMEEQVERESYAEKRSQRSQLLAAKSSSLAVDYILVLLDAHYASSASDNDSAPPSFDEMDESKPHNPCEMNLRRYNAETAVMEDLLIPKPPALRPCVLPTELRNQRVIPTEEKDVLNIQSKRTLQNGYRRIDSAHRFNDKASQFEHSAEQLLSLDEETIVKRYATRTGATTINPNAFSLARWRWNWAIRRVLDLGKIYVTMNVIFGGSVFPPPPPPPPPPSPHCYGCHRIMMQALSRTKGRLSIDYRKQDVTLEPQHNPYLGMELIAQRKYVPRAKEVEPLVPVPNFRSLQKSDKGSTYRCLSSAATTATASPGGAGAGAGGKGTEKKQIANTMDLIQESRERVKEKRREQKEREREMREKMEKAAALEGPDPSLSTAAAVLGSSASADPRDSLYRNRFAYIPPELR